MADLRLLGRRAWNLVTIGSNLQFLLNVGLTSIITAVVGRLVSALDWFPWPLLVLFLAGSFLVVFVALAVVMPRLWLPRGPFADVFGALHVLVGIDPDLDKRVFRNAPRLRRECVQVRDRLKRFVAEQQAEFPKPPPPPMGVPRQLPQQPTAEQQAYNEAMAAVQVRAAQRYNDI